MKYLLLAGLVLSTTVFAQESINDRVVKINRLCKERNINLGVYKLDKGCEVDLFEENVKNTKGICRGELKHKNFGKIQYKISIDTTQDGEIKTLATSDNSLWMIDTDKEAIIKAYQPNWKSHNNSRILIVSNQNSSSLSIGAQSAIHIVSKKADIVLLNGDITITEEAKIKPASIYVQTHEGPKELKNATCDLL